ncbi:MAG: 30S ribosomal protein S14, partial [Propioniciclava sp.]
MAKTSKIVANQRRIALVERYRERRDALRAQTKDASLTQAERQAASRALAALPRNSSPSRVRNRDQVDGRPR